MAVTTATLPISIADITQVFGTWEDCSTRSWATTKQDTYESRHNILFGRGMPETTQVLPLSRIFRNAHRRGGASIYRATIF